MGFRGTVCQPETIKGIFPQLAWVTIASKELDFSKVSFEEGQLCPRVLWLREFQVLSWVWWPQARNPNPQED
jgi:hypothetical protein